MIWDWSLQLLIIVFTCCILLSRLVFCESFHSVLSEVKLFFPSFCFCNTLVVLNEMFNQIWRYKTLELITFITTYFERKSPHLGNSPIFVLFHISSTHFSFCQINVGLNLKCSNQKDDLIYKLLLTCFQITQRKNITEKSKQIILTAVRMEEMSWWNWQEICGSSNVRRT